MDTPIIGERWLPVRPSTTDCLKWSAECELALADDERVHILIPRFRNSNTSTRLISNQLWDLVTLRTNLFRHDEVPTQQPLTFSSFSVGEETSTSSIVDLSWSPPGLALHLRSSLALLTSNLALSIWAATELPPQNPSSWKRLLVVNHALQSLYLKINPSDVQKPGHDASEQMKRFQRVRSFAWAPVAILPSDPNSNGLDSRQGPHLIAVANDQNQIIIVRVSPPHNKPLVAEKGNWSATALSHFKVDCQAQAELPSLSWTLENYMEKKSFLASLAWSPWQLEGKSDHALGGHNGERGGDESSDSDTLLSILAYATKSYIGFQRIRLTSDGVNWRVESEEMKFRLNLPHKHTLNGPLLWKLGIDRGRATILACAFDEVISCSLDLMGDPDPAIFRRKREEWDDIAGLAISPLRSGKHVLHISPLSLKDSTATLLNIPDLTVRSKGMTAWQDRALVQQSLFSLNNKLDGKAKTMLWGLACSPMGDFIASIYSHDPTEAITYYVSLDFNSTLLIKPVERSSDDRFQLPIRPKSGLSEDVAVEPIAFSIKYWLINHDPSKRTNQSTRTEILRAVLQSLGLPSEASEKDYNPTFKETSSLAITPASAAARLKDLLNTTVFAVQRVERLVSTLLDDHSRQWMPEDAPVFRKLHRLLKQLFGGQPSSDEISKTILVAYTAVFARSDPNFVGVDDPQDGSMENCDICEADIPWVECSQAECRNGHKFARCGLTFLAIQAPGISKHCGICGKQYLREPPILPTTQAGPFTNSPREASSIIPQDVDMTDDREAANTLRATTSPLDQNAQQPVGVTQQRPALLASAIFTACKTCIYCGGKFIG